MQLIPKAKCTNKKACLYPTQKSGVFMEAREYENAYYQVQDEVIESLPVEMDDEAFLD
ncbi:hypothetical protein GNT65_10585 [Shewanella sp. JBTF-M18]|uniref:Uncharacterized protein n=1 Tax=Shewanella insulae TaxID=2681496 RepID=A0A6L7HXZ2_9GAMM|nr:hypothetical protein [Shewanella insulae]